ncbi:MAG TPA: copper resistance protein [Casimicrobiaceae bacterium]
MSRRIACMRAAAFVTTVLLLTPAAHAAAAHAAAARQTVTALLEDTSTDPSVTRMEIVLDHRTIKAGPVTLRAINRSKTLVHEVLVLHDPGKKPLPYDSAKQEVDEHRIHSLGEVGDLAPGHSGTLNLDLTPGSYLLFCNEQGHYAEGMKTTLTVTR